MGLVQLLQHFQDFTENPYIQSKLHIRTTLAKFYALQMPHSVFFFFFMHQLACFRSVWTGYLKRGYLIVSYFKSFACIFHSVLVEHVSSMVW